ncbi:MAG: 4-hydroxythreonine-4-phosphate dehydrogenase PdxA [bacterium]
MSKPIIAVTMGDPAGIGPEVIAKALTHEWVLKACSPLIIGSERSLARAMRITGASFPYECRPAGEEFPAGFSNILLWNDEIHLREHIPLAAADPSCGASAFAWLERAIQLALEKRVAAIVTAPLNKAALNQAGHRYAGHTEILAEKTGSKEYSLMLIAGDFRVAHVTCHVAMSQVSSLLTVERIACAIRLFHEALSRLDGAAPRIAVCAFNPHAGEGGLFGDEEIRAITPAVHQCAGEGIQVSGPFPSDSIYPQMIGGRYNGVVAMYHDQGHIPFKLANFKFDPVTQEWQTVTGVNVTLGLPIIRASVDHGTAFDIAGTGKASEQSMLDAIRVALKLAGGSTP